MGLPTLLIADSSEEFIIGLSEALASSFCIHCCRSGLEALEYLRTTTPDMIVLDLMLPELDGISLLRTLREQGCNAQVFATTRLLSDFVIGTLQKLSVGYLVLKPCDIASTADRILELYSQSAPLSIPRGTQSTIQELLILLGISPKWKGFAYLRDAAKIMAETPGLSITKELYPAVGKKHNTTGSLVERSIRSAINSAWEKRNDQIWRQCFIVDSAGNVPHPTNSVFITCIANRIQNGSSF